MIRELKKPIRTRRGHISLANKTEIDLHTAAIAIMGWNSLESPILLIRDMGLDVGIAS